MTVSRRPRRKPQPSGLLTTADLQAPPTREIVVPYLPSAAKVPPRKRIHARRIIPQVPPGADAPDPDPTPPLALEPPQHRTTANVPEALAATANLVLVRNVELGSAADNNSAADVDEPSVATNGNVVFFTGNWYAAISVDGGATFRFVDPFTAFPDPPGMGFCCDQVVQYIPKIDTFVWLLQYTQNTAGENIQRLAFAKTADVQLGHWRIFDITPQTLGLPGAFLDFPDLAVGTNTLYLTVNAFLGQNWTATALVRMPLSGFSTGNVTAQHTLSRDNFNFRVAQNGGSRAYWASHQDTSTLRVFSWDEGAAQPVFHDVTIARWDAGAFQSRTPDGFNWLGRADPRIIGAATVGTEIWFCWGANSGGANNRPNPYAQIARINASSLAVLDNINLWDPNAAISYAVLASNSKREVGVSYMVGGGTTFPSHAVGVITGTRKDVITATGAHGPARNEWGDYLTIRRHYPNRKLYAATGYTLDRGTGSHDGNPRFILFGRSGDLA